MNITIKNDEGVNCFRMDGRDRMFFSSAGSAYIAIIGDIKNSRDIKSRKLAQEKMAAVLEKLNETYERDIAARFMITLGDEFQGLLSSGRNVLRMILEIEKAMYPIKIRFGIGIGTITTAINPDMAIGADGPGYYYAREAITYLKRNEKKSQVGVGNIRLETASENQGIQVLLNTILSLMAVIKEKWSERQREVIEDMLAHQDSQANLAARLGITQPTLQKILAKGNYYAYKQAIDTIGEALKEIGGES